MSSTNFLQNLCAQKLTLKYKLETPAKVLSGNMARHVSANSHIPFVGVDRFGGNSSLLKS